MNYEAIAQWSEIIGGFAFLVVAIALFRKYVLPAVRGAEAAHNADLVNAERHREELLAQLETMRREVETAGRDAGQITARGNAEAAREHERIVTEARREAARMIQNAKGELERNRQVARDRLRIELIEKALLRARELASQQVNPAVDERLVNRTVDDMSSGKGS